MKASSPGVRPKPTASPSALPLRTSPGSKSTRGERTRAALVAVASDKFRQLGFDKATTGEIAREAGVAEGTLFLHFGSKTGLLVGVMQTYYDALVEDLADEASHGATPERRLRNLVYFWLRRMRRDWSLMRVFGQHGRLADDPEVASRFVDMNRKVSRFFGGLFEDLKAGGLIDERRPTYILRDALFGTAEHLLLGIESTGRERDLETSAEHLCDLLLGGRREPAEELSQLARVEAKLDRLLERTEPGDSSSASPVDD